MSRCNENYSDPFAFVKNLCFIDMYKDKLALYDPEGDLYFILSLTSESEVYDGRMLEGLKFWDELPEYKAWLASLPDKAKRKMAQPLSLGQTTND